MNMCVRRETERYTYIYIHEYICIHTYKKIVEWRYLKEERERDTHTYTLMHTYVSIHTQR